MNKQIIDQILDAATKAPSGDNVQPWKIKVSEDFSTLDIFNLPEQDNSVYNYQQAASFVAHGALLENISIAATNFGYQAQIQLFPNQQENPNHIANISFQISDTKNNPLYEAIFSRCTNRFHFDNCHLPAEHLSKLVDSMKQFEGIKGYFTNDADTIKELAKTLMVNDQLVFEREDIHQFLFDKIRWNQAQLEATRDGMPVDTLGLSGLEKLFFPLMKFWWFVNYANHLGLSRVIGIKCWNNCRNAGLIGQITVKKTDSYNFVMAGRALQCVWLEATRQGYAFQPIIGLPLLVYRAKSNALQSFSRKHIQLIQNSDIQVRKLLGIEASDEIVVGFRIGKGRELTKKTLRKPVISS